jgi:hypothetical protein
MSAEVRHRERYRCDSHNVVVGAPDAGPLESLNLGRVDVHVYGMRGDAR